MMRKILLFLLLFSFYSNYSQDSIAYFSNVLRSNIKPYINASNKAYAEKDFLEGQRLFDSLVQYNLVGTKFDDFTVKIFPSKKMRLSAIDKPVFIVTYASWCVINKGDPPALNKLAKEYLNDVNIIVLLWDRKSEVKKIARLFSKNITICYANENYINDSHLVARLKHTLGFPTSYFIDENKNVINICRVLNPHKPRTSSIVAMAKSYTNFNTIINEALTNKIAGRSKLTKN
ncbi:thioredoxin family protein [Flavobacterium sp. LS1R49]|uniref:Thioredoxin family protein n=1 Tax=Flavobacterium shii TaxID=2987687 RepID=A0A9X3BYK9_9FLAO|nr:thioredoxin family protein [Flavobacterium shii]MCV9928990.1 thioredoxin family protein [Flavobacterium shii]